MKNIVLLAVGVLALGACGTQTVPDSGSSVGFSDYAQYELERAQREAALQGQPAPTLSNNGAMVPPSSAARPTAGANTISTTELVAAGINTGAAAQTDTPVVPTTVAPLGSNPELSDEQNFDAVASRQSIESDAERRERQAAAYQLIEATALPDRPGDAGPNIVQYALQAPNNRGEQVFTRSGLSGENRFQRNCAKYTTPDAAQRDFLERGGPSRDRLGIDPDGDGFACGWDPQAFRSISTGN